MNVPFLDLQAAYEELQPQIDEAVSRVLKSGRYILGEEVDAFEEEFARYVDARHCVGVGNGLDALALSLKAVGIGPGDEVIVPAHTFIATWLAVTEVGATPVPVDIDEYTYNIDPAQIKAAITANTRAIIPVHLYGHPADLDPILDIANGHGLNVVEDAAQAHGARYKGRRLGAHGHLVAWSFYPSKNLGAMGDGGAITTNDCELSERLRMLRNYGSKEKYHHEICGVNSRLDPIQAAILRVKLEHMDEWNQRRVEVAEYYSDSLKETKLKLPETARWAEHVWHLYVVRASARDHFLAELTKKQIGAMIHYPVVPLSQPAYRRSDCDERRFTITERLSNEVVSLPIGPHVNHDKASMVIEAVRDILDAKSS